MKTITVLSTMLAAALVALLLATPLYAAPKTFVASNGGGTICSRTQPCADITVAINAADAGGEVNCLDSGPIPATLGLFKSITIDCVGSIITSASAAFANTPGIVVRIRHLTLTGNPGFDGLHVSGIGTLFVENCVIENFSHAGIEIDGSVSQLNVSDTVFSNNGGSGITAAILIKLTSGTLAKVTIERTRIENNFFGIIADGTNGGLIRGIVRDSVVSGNINNGITVSSAGVGAAVLSVENTSISGNNFGLAASGTNAGILVSQSNIMLNNTGLFTANGGVLLSYKDNKVNGNTTTDGTFTGPVGQQ